MCMYMYLCITQRQLPLEPGPVGINCCCFNHNGQVLLTGGVDGVVRLFGKFLVWYPKSLLKRAMLVINGLALGF